MFINNKILINYYFFFLDDQYEKSDFIKQTENNSQPMNSLEKSEPHKGNIFKFAAFNSFNIICY